MLKKQLDTYELSKGAVESSPDAQTRKMRDDTSIVRSPQMPEEKLSNNNNLRIVIPQVAAGGSPDHTNHSHGKEFDKTISIKKEQRFALHPHKNSNDE